MSDVDEKLTLEVLKKLQQRLHHAEMRIDGYQTELSVYREQQVAVLKDLHKIYELLGYHHERLKYVPTSPNLALQPGDSAR